MYIFKYGHTYIHTCILLVQKFHFWSRFLFIYFCWCFFRFFVVAFLHLLLCFCCVVVVFVVVFFIFCCLSFACCMLRHLRRTTLNFLSKFVSNKFSLHIFVHGFVFMFVNVYVRVHICRLTNSSQSNLILCLQFCNLFKEMFVGIYA